MRGNYVDKKADILFLIDTSGSLSSDDYDKEKGFVRDLLNEISVGHEATWVEVIPFGNSASLYIDQVSNPNITKNKCTFNEKFNLMEQKINGWSTNTKAAFDLAFDVCRGRLSGGRRVSSDGKPIKTTVLLLTDGDWNYDANPISTANKLHPPNGEVEVFAIGLGKYLTFDNLKSVTNQPDKQAFLLENFNEVIVYASYFIFDYYYLLR